MKKLAACMLCGCMVASLLVGCGGSDAPAADNAAGGDSSAASEGDSSAAAESSEGESADSGSGSGSQTINLWAFTDEVPGMIEKYKEMHPDFGWEINTTIIATTDGAYQPALDQALAAWFTDKRSKVKGQGAYKVLLYMPNIITAATIAILFSGFFGYPMGPVNDLLVRFGFIEKPIELLRSKAVARGVIIFIQTWMWYGSTMITLISGILGISPEIFESAEVDGANRVQTFFYITIPNIKTILLFTLVTSLIGGLNMFDIPRLFQDGKPDDATLTTSLYIYKQAFSGSYLYNRAAAASMVMFVIIGILSAIMFFVMRDKDEAQLRKQIKQQQKAYKMKLKSGKENA